MFEYVIQIDKNVIEVNYHTDVEKIRENIVHELLEGYRGITIYSKDL